MIERLSQGRIVSRLLLMEVGARRGVAWCRLALKCQAKRTKATEVGCGACFSRLCLVSHRLQSVATDGKLLLCLCTVSGS